MHPEEDVQWSTDHGDRCPSTLTKEFALITSDDKSRPIQGHKHPQGCVTDQKEHYDTSKPESIPAWTSNFCLWNNLQDGLRSFRGRFISWGKSRRLKRRSIKRSLLKDFVWLQRRFSFTSDYHPRRKFDSLLRDHFQGGVIPLRKQSIVWSGAVSVWMSLVGIGVGKSGHSFRDCGTIAPEKSLLVIEFFILRGLRAWATRLKMLMNTRKIKWYN